MSDSKKGYVVFWRGDVEVFNDYEEAKRFKEKVNGKLDTFVTDEEDVNGVSSVQ